jgi:glycosyltransferase involved in cell wall biosynthesis
VRAELGVPPEAVLVGTVGRLVGEKDVPLLVRALAPELGPDLRLAIVGEGAARKEIERAIDPGTRPFVTLTGRRTDVPALLSAFDVFALSSRTEGLPLVVPEAMASALPVVATAVGGLPGIVPKEVGALVPHGDERALRAAVLELACDREQREGKGRAARAYAHERFSIDRMTRDYERLYRGE